MHDLLERLRRAEREVYALSVKAAELHNTTEYSRLTGKLDGIRMSIAYAEETLRV